jgi:hypothetical protein
MASSGGRRVPEPECRRDALREADPHSDTVACLGPID